MIREFDDDFDVLDQLSLSKEFLTDKTIDYEENGSREGFFKSEPKIQNIVATINMGCTVDLRTVALCARNAEYNPRRFAAVVMRIRNPRTTALIFSSGKLVVTGSTTFVFHQFSEEEARIASRKHARIIQKLGFPAHFLDFKIQNIVASCDVSFPIRLEGIMTEHSLFCSYEPELFPGLVYRLIKPKVVVLIFVSGKVVFTGAKVRSDILDAYKAICPILYKFRKDASSEKST